jgi:tetratricopeptide (TPR) repeat protein
MYEKDTAMRLTALIYLLAIAAMAYYYWLGTDASIDWKVTTHAETSEFAAHEFQKGPFSFSIPGKYYTLTESFSAGPIDRHFTRDGILLAVSWLGICIILAMATTLSLWWFLGIAGLFLFMLIGLQLPSITLFGFDASSQWGNVLLLALFMAPAYGFNAFWKNTSFFVRLLTFVAASAVVVAFGITDIIAFQEQLNVGMYFSMVVLMLLFLLIIAEENVFAILFLVTKSKGGDNNEKHFSVFSLVYLVFIGLVYSKKAGFIKVELPFFDPYVLLIISSIMVLWSLWHKRDLYENIMTYGQAMVMVCGVGLAIFGYLTLAFARGNDAVYEGLHYFIIYAHFGFGIFFFLYSLVNFVDPLRRGLQVYKIAFKPQPFPYVSARLAGIVAVVAFFFMSNKEAFMLFKAGHFNYLGEQAAYQNENGLAVQYYEEGSIYGHDNHFSNYKLAYNFLQKDKIKEASHKFGRATLRYPSPQSFVNESSTASMLGDVTPALVTLKTGLKRFPGENTMLNNVGLIYMDLGNYDEAANYFSQANDKGDWNNANTVNLWKIGRGTDAVASYETGNLAVKSNVLAALIVKGERAAIAFDENAMTSTLPLHQQIYLINSTWYFGSSQTAQPLGLMTEMPMDEGIYDVSLQTLAISAYNEGDVNYAIKRLDQLYHLSSASDRGKYLNQIGLICLDQHSIALAHTFFDRALAEGEKDAKLNKAVAFLEGGEFENALKWMQAMAKEDSLYAPLANDFEKILGNAEPTQDQRLARMYYRYSDFSLPEIKVFAEKQDPLYVRTLWDKISAEMLQEENFSALEDYLSVLKPMLKETDYADALAIVAINQNLSFAGNHPVALALQEQNDTLRIARLVEIADKNALDEALVIAVAKKAESIAPNKAYELLVQAIDINDKNTRLLQAYAFSALEISLAEYAYPVIEKLKVLLSKTEFDAFKNAFDEHKAKQESEKAQW